MRDFYALCCHKMRDCAKKGGREDKRRHVIINKLCISRGLSVVETFCGEIEERMKVQKILRFACISTERAF